MHDLEKFYYTRVFTVVPSQRYNPITVIDDVVVVNFDCLYDREGNIRGTDQLLFLLHKQGHNKRFLFISEDGALINISGARFVIENIIKVFKLTSDTCCIIAREHLPINNCHVIIKESIQYWARVLFPHVRDIPIHSPPFDQIFAIWYHRGSIHRLELAQHLLENHKESSYISYQEQGMITDRNLTQYFKQQLTWSEQHTPIIYDQLFPNRVYNFNMIVGPARKPYDKYFLEVVAETDIITTDWITEKTIKNLYIGKPFIVMGGAGILRRLRSYGFETFNPWIDESYDDIDNIYDRLTAIKQEIDRISTVDIDQLYQQLLPILVHNRKTYEKYIIGR